MNNKETTPPAKKINLKLSVNEVNLVLKALGNLPFNEVFELIGTIHDQANAQSHDNG
jgi:hypothetical protein